MVLISALFAVYIENADLGMTHNGLLGFINSENSLQIIFFYSFLTGFMGGYGYIIAT